jgi:hypothetical protein
MNRYALAAMLASVLLVNTAFAQSQAPSRVRGTITAVDGNTVSVKSREGHDLKIEVAADTTFAYMKRVDPADVKPGTALGTTAVKGKEGELVARELHLFNPERPIPNEGHRPWDLEPESTMTNARVATKSGNELTLTYKGGEQRVVVPAGTPIVMAVESDRSVLVAGEYAYIAVAAGTDGRLKATRFQVSKDGVRPPQ